MATGDSIDAFDDRLFELYPSYVPEPESRKDVYGYAVLFVGYVLGLVGVLIYLFGWALVDAGGATFLIRDIATVLSAAGLVLALLGIVLMVPVVTRQRRYVSEVRHRLERNHPAIMVGEAARGAVFAVYM